MLIVGRVLQGVGAAPMLLALAGPGLQRRSRRPSSRGRWGSGRRSRRSALAIGPLAGGLLVELDWRVIFWMNLPMARRWGSRSSPGGGAGVDRPRRRAAARLGRAGGALASASPRSSWRWSSRAPGAPARSRPWRSADCWRWPPSGGSSTASRAPIVEFELFRNGPYFGASAAAFALVGAYWAVMFFQPQYLQDVRGHSAIALRPDDPADHGADDLRLAVLRAADRPLRRRGG